MHKVVKVRIHRGDPTRGEHQLEYPDRYHAQEVDQRGQLIGPRLNGYSGHIGRGGDEEWCLIVLPDELADEYARDTDMEIIPVAKADDLRERWAAISHGDIKESDTNDYTSSERRYTQPLSEVVRGVELV
jgi:hypothetical protein